jgi:hypothetical protein
VHIGTTLLDSFWTCRDSGFYCYCCCYGLIGDFDKDEFMCPLQPE